MSELLHLETPLGPKVPVYRGWSAILGLGFCFLVTMFSVLGNRKHQNHNTSLENNFYFFPFFLSLSTY